LHAAAFRRSGSLFASFVRRLRLPKRRCTVSASPLISCVARCRLLRCRHFSFRRSQRGNIFDDGTAAIAAMLAAFAADAVYRRKREFLPSRCCATRPRCDAAAIAKACQPPAAAGDVLFCSSAPIAHFRFCRSFDFGLRVASFRFFWRYPASLVYFSAMGGALVLSV